MDISGAEVKLGGPFTVPLDLCPGYLFERLHTHEVLGHEAGSLPAFPDVDDAEVNLKQAG